MKIKIAERLRPFSHRPGAACLVPGTWEVVEAFPTRVRVGSVDLRLDLTGPVSEFTLEQDLEKNCVWIFGRAKEGFYRLRVEASDAGFHLYAEKVPPKGLTIDGKVLKAKDRLDLPAEIAFVMPKDFERLSLGNHKAQDWDAVQKRADLKEMLPILFFLGQKIPHILPQPLLGTARLLELPADRNLVEAALIAYLKAAFSKILVPRLIDDEHQGLAPEEPVSGNPCFLIQEAHKKIRALFFQQNERRLRFLPCLPPAFDCGRMLSLKAAGVGEIDFEWSKKTLQCAIFRASTSGEVILELPKEIGSYRVRATLSEKGSRLDAAAPLLLESGKTYYLDRFHKV